MENEHKKSRLSVLIPWLLFIIALAAAGYFGYQLYAVKGAASQVSPQDETAKIINEVGKLIVLPQGETPTIATVSDLSKLQGQPFFTNAKVGDIVLIYAKAQKAILYDPMANKIIELAPVYSGTNVNSASSTAASSTSSANIKSTSSKSKK